MSNSSFLVSLLGSMPRSKKLLTAKRKFNKGKIDESTYFELLDEETKYVVTLQENNDIDIITNGELSRDNYVSFIAEKLNGVSMMSMADMFDYIEDKQGFEQILEILDVPAISIKNAICTGKITYNKPLVADEMIALKKLTKKKIKATLPGPYLMTRSMWLPALSQKYYSNKAVSYTHLSQYFSAVASICVDISILAPLSLLSHIRFIKSLIAIGSRPRNGSSIIYNFGSTKKAQIIITFCFIPFEK